MNTASPRPIRTIIDGEIVLYDLPGRTLERMKPKLALQNPKWAAMRRFAPNAPTTEPEKIECAIEMPDGSLHVPRGAVDFVKEELKKDGLVMRVEDRRANGSPISVIARDFFPPRDYQQEGVDRVKKHLQGVVVLPCGTGKTKLGGYAVLALRTTTLILVHTSDLADQWLADMQAFGIDGGLIGDGHNEGGRDVVIGLIQSVLPLLERDPSWGARFGFVIVDECFPAGTLVSGKPIEEIRTGDVVDSFDPTTNAPSRQRVVRTIRKKCSALVRVHFDNGKTITCTPSHKLWSGNEWIKASDCLHRHVMLNVMNHHEDVMRSMRQKSDDNTKGPELPTFLRTLQSDATERAAKTSHSSMRHLRDTGHDARLERARTSEDRTSLLLDRTQGRMEVEAQLGSDGKHEPDTCFGTHESQKPDAQSRNKSKAKHHTPSDGLEAADSRREREDITGPTTPSSIRSGVAVRSGCEDVCTSAPLQDRHRERNTDDSDRSGWGKSRIFESAGCRYTKSETASFARVDLVEILEPTSDGTFGGMCPNGFVYDLEVENTHTYFADGVAVSNCHHVPASTFQAAMRSLPARYRLGLSATPEREDGLGWLVDWSFGRILLERNTREMIKAGYLMAATIETVETGFTWSYNGPETKKLAKLEEAIADDFERNAQIAARVAIEAKAGETCLVLCRTRAHTKVLADMIVKLGVEARALTGGTAKKKRKATLNDMRGGTLAVSCATSLADEGLDLPRLSCVALASPQRAKGATVQRLGRLLRLWRGKKPKLLDFVDGSVATLASRAKERRKVYVETGLLISDLKG